MLEYLKYFVRYNIVENCIKGCIYSDSNMVLLVLNFI